MSIKFKRAIINHNRIGTKGNEFTVIDEIFTSLPK
jgi:hypothetical protein